MIECKQYSTVKLCQIIVTARYLGSMREEAVACMQELALRRQSGEEFLYENFIENELKKLPNFKEDLRKKMQLGSLELLKMGSI